MANPRTLLIKIKVNDDGGPDDYDRILEGLSHIGAEIVDEEEVPYEA